MAQGWVYVLVNSSMPGIAKVGRTMRPAGERAAELSAATGVATPFVVAFDQAFTDCIEAERLVHAELDRRGLRIAPNREFFKGAPSDIVRVILEAAEGAGVTVAAVPDHSAESLRLTADRLLYGTGDTLQDTGEAMRCYRLAASRGSLLAMEQLGRLFGELYLARRNRSFRRRALSMLKNGARGGNYYCYAELGRLFAAEGHAANFAKAWDLFFAHRAARPLPELEAPPYRLGVACGAYVGACLALGVAPSHMAELRQASEAIIAALLRELDTLRRAAKPRQKLTRVLRWVYENVLPSPAPVVGKAAPSLPQPRQFFPRQTVAA